MATELQVLLDHTGSLASVPGAGIVTALVVAVAVAEIMRSVFRFFAEMTVGRLDPLEGLVVRGAVLGVAVAVGWQKLAPFAGKMGSVFLRLH